LPFCNRSCSSAPPLSPCLPACHSSTPPPPIS
jgi:hypothetical protein